MGEAAQAGGGASAALHLPGAPVDGSLLEGCVFFSAVTHRAISLGASAAGARAPAFRAAPPLPDGREEGPRERDGGSGERWGEGGRGRGGGRGGREAVARERDTSGGGAAGLDVSLHEAPLHPSRAPERGTYAPCPRLVHGLSALLLRLLRDPSSPVLSSLPSCTSRPPLRRSFADSFLLSASADPIPAPRRRGRPAGRRPAAKGFPEVQRLPTVSLGNLISAGLLEPGADVLSVSYKGSTHHASLTPGGTIEWNGRAYSSASAFSIAVKRLATPDKQGDDGWKSVVYHGRPLDELRQELRARLNTGASATRTPRTRRAKRATPESGEDERESGEDDAAAGPGSAAAAAHAGAGASSSSQVSASNSGADPPRWESQTNAPSEPGHGAGLPGGCPPPSGVGLPSGCPPPPGAAPAVGPLGAALVNGAPPAPPGGIAPPRREMAPGDALIAAQAALLRGVPPGVPPSQAASALAFATGRAGGGALPHVPAGPWPGQGLPPGFHSQT